MQPATPQSADKFPMKSSELGVVRKLHTFKIYQTKKQNNRNHSRTWFLIWILRWEKRLLYNTRWPVRVTRKTTKQNNNNRKRNGEVILQWGYFPCIKNCAVSNTVRGSADTSWSIEYVTWKYLWIFGNKIHRYTHLKGNKNWFWGCKMFESIILKAMQHRISWSIYLLAVEYIV